MRLGVSRNVLCLSLLLSAGTAGLSGCKAPPPAEATGVQKALILRASAAEAGRYAITGTVVARHQSALGFRVPGKIVERLVELGTHVTKGQPLLRIDPTDYVALATASTANLAAAQAQFDRASANEIRLKSLLAGGSIAQDTYEQAKAQRDAAEGALKAAQAQSLVSSNQKDYAYLRADVDGVITSLSAEPGQVVMAGQPVLGIAQDGPREAAIMIPENKNPPSTTTARLINDTPETFQVTLRTISPLADPATHGFEARYLLTSDPQAFKLGESISLDMPEASVTAQVVPVSAIFVRGRGPQIWIYDPSHHVIHAREVKLGALDQDNVALTSGLSSGDIFIAAGAFTFHEGEKIEPVEGHLP